MSKFRHFEESRIHLGVGEIHIQEVNDGVHVTISEEIDHSIRLGIPDEHGISYNYWRDLVKHFKDATEVERPESEELKMSEDVVELEEDDLKQEEKKKVLRPKFIEYKDKDLEFIGIEFKDMNNDKFIISWEKDSDMPVPMTTYDLDVINSASQIGRVVFYQEMQKICDKVVSGS